MHIHTDALDEVRDRVVAAIERDGQITLAGLRDELQTSRKYAQALLEHFDARARHAAPRRRARAQAPAGFGAVGSAPSPPGLLARHVVLDLHHVVARALDDAQQVGHRRDLLDLLLDEPLHELLARVVALVAGASRRAR